MPDKNYNDIFKEYLNLIISDYKKYINPEKLIELENNIENILSTEEINESQIIQRIFKKLIALTSNQKLDDALIDFCAITFLQGHHKYPEYQIKEPRYLIKLKEQLLSIDDLNTELNLIFNGGIDQIINQEKLDKTTDFDLLLQSISKQYPANPSEFEENLIKLSARVKNQEEALKTIKDSIQELGLDFQNEVTNQINNYLYKKTNTNTI